MEGEFEGNQILLNETEKLAIHYYLIQCEHDKDINKGLKTTLEAMSRNKKARVVQLKGAGHIANLDAPDEFNRVLNEILTGL